MSEQNYAIRPNKTQLKREIRELNQLGQELLKLPSNALDKIPLSDSMKSAVNEGKRLSKGALQRQLRRIASLMRNEDVAAIRFELDRHKQPSKEQTETLHQLEKWRDRLVAGDEPLLTSLIDQFPTIDRQYLRQLMRNAQREVKRANPPKSSRLIFQYLSQVHQEHDQSVSDASNDLAPNDY